MLYCECSKNNQIKFEHSSTLNIRANTPSNRVVKTHFRQHCKQNFQKVDIRRTASTRQKKSSASKSKNMQKHVFAKGLLHFRTCHIWNVVVRFAPPFFSVFICKFRIIQFTPQRRRPQRIIQTRDMDWFFRQLFSKQFKECHKNGS